MAEFKIGRLRFTWKGAWDNGVVYNRDAVVSFSGKTYVCLQPHTSAVNFYDDLDYITQAGEIQPRWQLMIDGKVWQGPWTPNTLYGVGAIISYGGSLYECTIPHTSGSTSIDLSKWIVSVSSNSTWLNVWTQTTLYRVGSIIKYGGIVYRCTTEHTSATTTLGLEHNFSNWEIVDAGIEYKGTWTATTRYKLNDLVKQASNVWICTNGHTSSTAFVPGTDWDLWLEGLTFDGEWNNTTTYQIGDVVIYGGYSYYSKVSTNLGNNPSTSTANWELLTTGYELKSDWDATVNYKIGDVVRAGGNLFVATADNSQANPTIVSGETVPSGQERRRACTSSSGRTLVIDDTTGISVGMNISSIPGVAQYFKKGQTVTEIIDANTLTISDVADAAPDGNDIDFFGVNDNWEVLVQQVRWRNRWTLNAQYIAGDIAVWVNVTYRCIKTHQADQNPSIDNNHNWVGYLQHDKFNVLNLSGDIVVNSDGDNQALSIGPEGFLLKSVIGVPTWQNVFQTPNVFYVTPDGTDLPGSGTTWDNPYGSIKYACEQVEKGVFNPNTRTLLTSNKEFIITEAYEWQYNQVDPLLDEEKTKRDSRLILDGIIYDVSRGGNSQTVANALSYFDIEQGDKFTNLGVDANIASFIATITKLFNLVNTVVQGNTVSPIYQTINGASPLISQIPGSSLTDNGIIDKINSLRDILITALTEGNTSSIPPANTGATSTIMVKTGTYSETLPIVVPANTALNGDELRGVVVRPKIIINTIASRSRASTNAFTVGTTEGMTDGTPVQFVSMNPVAGTSTVFGGVTAGQTYYVIGSSITPTAFSVSANYGSSTPVTLVNFISTMRVYGGDALSDMFRVRNGSGIRNMTLTGLLGTLTTQNAFMTRRPTGGSFVSLDPGTGPDDTPAWITRRSPYIQNVTNFGIGCVGLKIDGTLHNGGNKSIVCNDFTQIISDGIGVWTTGPDSLCEAVSVFSYYNYAGYMAEDGGRIRATNGNSSYGTYGCIAEGYDSAELPITAAVNNQYNQASATPISSLGSNASILALQYLHAGENYTQDTTNLLSYSNVFTNWASDGNVTLVQSIVSPSAQSDGWIATGNTSGSNSSYFYQNITVAPSGAVYTAVAGTNESGSGIGALFDITVTSTEYIVTVNDGGSGYVATNQIRILGSQLGGINGTNDLLITVTGLTNGTTIQLIGTAGTVQVGSTQPYTFSVYCKQGTATDFEVNATFSGVSTTSSIISYNFASKIITASAGSGGFIPTSYGAIPVSSAPGWYRLYFTFYDSNALNNSLQIRFYPRSKFGNSGYTLLYGSQLEVGETLGFYLKTTTNRFTSYANYEIVGAGSGVDVVGEEIRTGSIFQTRILNSLGETGGSGHVLATNNAQTGTTSNITIAATDSATDKTYLGMRIFINSGAGAGQYGVVSSFDPSFKIASVLKESFKQVTITSTNSNTGEFTLSSTDDVNSLYVDQIIQFIPTNYNTTVTTVSQTTMSVTGITGGIINTISVPSTTRLTVNMPVTFSGITYGGVTSGFSYYIVAIVDDYNIQVSTTVGGAVLLLTTSLGNMSINYPSNTSYLTGPTANMEVNLPIFFTGIVLDSINTGTTYYINEIVDSSTFTISPTLISTTATATAEVTNRVTLDASTNMVPITPIVFSGTGFGGVTAATKYYVNNVVDSTHITISDTLITASATVTSVSGNQITVNSTTGFVIGNPITFVGTTFGGIVNDRVYYILYVNNATTFTISSTSTLLQVNATATTITTNRITANTTVNLTPLNPITFSGTSAGGITTGTTYYVSRIPSSTQFVVSESIVTTTATGTAATSNLITVASTAGFIVNNPIVFGGPAIGGINAGQVYFISAINDSNTFTVSIAPSGAAIVLSTATSGTMTVRTTGADLPLSTTSVTLTGTTTYGGSAVTLTAGTGLVIVKTTGQPLALSTATGSLTATTTSAKQIIDAATGAMTGTFTVPLLGAVAQGTSYYVKSVTPGPNNVFTLSDIAPGGALFVPTSSTGSMVMGEVGWDHVTPGTPSVSSFDSSTVYSIEPRVVYSGPNFSSSQSSTTLQSPGTTYVAVTYGNNKFVGIPNTNQTIAVSSDGQSWLAKTLPTSASWKGIAYGNKYWVIMSSGGTAIPGSKVLYSNSNLETWKTSYLPSIGNWSKVVYGNGKFVAITSDSGSAASSLDFGANWTSMTGLSSTTWVDLVYGGGKFVAIASGGRTIAYSTNGTSWTVLTTALPVSSAWTGITYGSGRYVAVSSAGIAPAYSLDGITWSSALYPVTAGFVTYGQGAFVAVSSGAALGYSSEDGIRWTNRLITSSTVGGIAFGFNSTYSIGRFVTVGNRSESVIITAGTTPKARASVSGGKIKQIYEWETGSNYTSVPTVSVIDTNATIPSVLLPRLGNGTLSNPTFINKGTGYNTATTSITLTGAGYADDYQTGLSIILKNITQLPRAGDNLAIAGDATIYKVTDATALNGTVAPYILGRIQVSPEITVAASPNNDTAVTIRTKYSQVRLTNHDFLNIGYGNFEQSSYPGLPSDTSLASNNEIIENNYGRAFYSSTDQDGNFKVGNLFAVEQATGIVTLSASQFGLTGLTQLKLGGVSVGNASVIITQFSTDSTFVANSDKIIPTQKAIRSYLTARLSQGGSNTFTGQLTAGTVVVGGPDKIGSTVQAGQEGSVVNIPVVANVHGVGDGAGGGYGAWDGNGMAMAYFVKSGAHR